MTTMTFFRCSSSTHPTQSRHWGTAVSDVSERILRQIEAIVKKYEKENEHDKPEFTKTGDYSIPNLKLSETPEIGNTAECAGII